MCGDSTSIDAVEALLQGKKAQMVHTDPPYGISYQSNGRTKSAKFDVLKNDDVIPDIAPVVDTCSRRVGVRLDIVESSDQVDRSVRQPVIRPIR